MANRCFFTHPFTYSATNPAPLIMNLKLPLFFIAVFSVLVYLDLFWKNRHEKVRFRFLRKEAEVGLGLLVLTAFIDGALLTVLLLWLTGHINA